MAKPTSRWGLLLVAAFSGVVVGSAVTYGVVTEPEPPTSQTSGREAEIHDMGHQVMPFALDSTNHVFEMTTSGGIQDVVAKNPTDRNQVRLIRQHLAHEARRFQSGDFSDPSSLHGAAMPGLKELSGAGVLLQVAYEDIPAGGRIAFSSSDAVVITALHRWFGAQLSDHGADATYR